MLALLGDIHLGMDIKFECFPSLLVVNNNFYMSTAAEV